MSDAMHHVQGLILSSLVLSFCSWLLLLVCRHLLSVILNDHIKLGDVQTVRILHLVLLLKIKDTTNNITII